jgi:hypothetical protein
VARFVLQKKLLVINALLGLLVAQNRVSAGNPECDGVCKAAHDEKWFCSGSCTHSVYKGMNIYTCSACGT